MKHVLQAVLVTLGLVGSGLAFADSEYSEGFNQISNKTFRQKLSIKGELFVMDASGKKLQSPTPDIREWRAGSKSNRIEAVWKTTAKGIRDIAVIMECDIRDDNSISMTLKQYESIQGHYGKLGKIGKLINEQKIDVENFAGVSYVAENGPNHRVVLRFTPTMEAGREETTIDKISIGGDTGTFIVSDNQGYLWADNVRFGGVISGLSTHRGAVVFSFYPFKGAKEMGTAVGNKIELGLTDTLKLTIRNNEALVPGGSRIKVYAKYVPKFKMDSPNSVFSWGQNKEDQLPKELGL